MEQQMWQIVGGLQGTAAEQDSPSAKARALTHQAFAAEDEPRRVELAKEALAIDADCADAYVLLAEHAHSRREALALYQQGLAAGERALGPQGFQKAAGHFWSLLETRPYLRARLGLAHALWTAGRRDEAVQHLQEMLRLNPGDNQGVHYTLAGFFLFLDRDDDLAHLLAQYPDEGSATWAYTRALLAFRRAGDTPEARQLLQEAKQTNQHVPDYLLGRKFPPAEQPNYYSPGAESEALDYVAGFLAGWKATPGAIAWLRANEPKPRQRRQGPQPKGPLSVVKKWLNKHLPLEAHTWQADCRQLSGWIEGPAEPVRPWLIVVADRSNDLVLAHGLSEEEPSSALVWDTLVQAMQRPAAGEPHRPHELQVRSDERWQALRPHLEEIGVALAESTDLDLADVLFRELSEELDMAPEPGLLDVPGVTPEQVESFYAAAAAFYEQAPWKKVGYESAIQVECGKFQSGPWYAVLIGQSGLMIGLALYEDLAGLRRMWTRAVDDEANARQTVATSVTFGETTHVPVADLEAARRYGWKVARPDAYPSIFHKERGLSMRPPLAWELELMEGCLRALPDFVRRRRQDDPTREEVTVPMASGPLTLGLSWVVEP
jgi:tetratricopeptide (TPR) repeat protein